MPLKVQCSLPCIGLKLYHQGVHTRAKKKKRIKERKNVCEWDIVNDRDSKRIQKMKIKRHSEKLKDSRDKEWQRERERERKKNPLLG